MAAEKNREPPLSPSAVLGSDIQLRKIFDFILTPFFILFFASVLFFYDLVFRIWKILFPASLDKVAAWLNSGVRFSLRVLGTKFKIEREIILSSSAPLIIVANHQSMFDISIIHRAFAEVKPRFVAKVELGRRIPGVSFCLRNEGSALIDRSSPSQSARELMKFADRIKAGKFAAVLFPEGTRGRDGILKDFHSTGLAVLLKKLPDAQVIPVAIDGSWRFSARPFWLMPTGVTVYLKASPAINCQGKNAEQVMATCRESIEQMLGELQ